uniref:Ig-like domain-containing protein n=1 Tax=Cyprinodon variegatus TaxID=28743 RepID=A0A3Q2CUT7_CYPVA
TANLQTVPLTPSLLLCISLTFLSCLCSSPTDVVSIPAEPGQNINLTCRATKNSLVTVLRLTRDDLKQQKEVFVYRNGKINEKSLNPQFKGRTSLQSLSTADGEVNVTLSNVTKEDNGTYGCLAVTKEGRLETIIHLHVDPPGESLWIRTFSSFLVLDGRNI